MQAGGGVGVSLRACWLAPTTLLHGLTRRAHGEQLLCRADRAALRCVRAAGEVCTGIPARKERCMRLPCLAAWLQHPYRVTAHGRYPPPPLASTAAARGDNSAARCQPPHGAAHPSGGVHSTRKHRRQAAVAGHHERGLGRLGCIPRDSGMNVIPKLPSEGMSLRCNAGPPNAEVAHGGVKAQHG